MEYKKVYELVQVIVEKYCNEAYQYEHEYMEEICNIFEITKAGLEEEKMDYEQVYKEVKQVVDSYYGDVAYDFDADYCMEKIGGIVDSTDDYHKEAKRRGLVRFLTFLNDNDAGVRFKEELVDTFLKLEK